MTNNPLNGYQPEYADAIADAQEHNIEHAKASQGGGSPDSPILPTCRFCGRQILPVDKYADAKAANEAATRQCDCPQAREYQAELERAEKREKNINKLRKALDDVSAYFTKERGVEYTDALYNLLFNCGVAVIDAQVEKANLNFGRVKVAISTNSKGAIVIALAYSDGFRVEV